MWRPQATAGPKGADTPERIFPIIGSRKLGVKRIRRLSVKLYSSSAIESFESPQGRKRVSKFLRLPLSQAGSGRKQFGWSQNDSPACALILRHSAAMAQCMPVIPNTHVNNNSIICNWGAIIHPASAANRAKLPQPRPQQWLCSEHDGKAAVCHATQDYMQ